MFWKKKCFCLTYIYASVESNKENQDPVAKTLHAIINALMKKAYRSCRKVQLKINKAI